MNSTRTSWLGRCLGFLFILGLVSCAPGAASTPVPTPTPLPTAVVPENPTYTVERGPVVDELTFTGRVAPVHEEELYFRTDGRVLDVYVERGDKVTRGELLTELDVAALYRQVDQAQLALETADVNLANAEDQRLYDLARAQVNLQMEEIALGKLLTYNPADELPVRQAELKKAEHEVQEAQARYDAISHVPDIAMRPEAQELQEATLAYAQANSAYQRAVGEAEQQAYDVQNQRKQVELARLEVARLEQGVDPSLEQAIAQAELELLDLRAQITDTQILAPWDGEVTAVSTAAGRAVEGFDPVLVVADPTQLEVTAELAADDMRQLSEGQAATLIPVEYPGQERAGTIRSLPYPYGSGGSTTTIEDEDRTTHLSADLGDMELEPGDLVRVTVVLERKDRVLWLPPAAIRTFEGRKFVVVQEDGGQRRVDVILGIESENRIEIVEGLDEGQIVIGQ